MKILALDLGTKTGFAYSRDNEMTAGTLRLASKGDIAGWSRTRMLRRSDPRIHRLYSELERFHDPDIVVFEDVEFSTYTYQCQLWSSLRAAVWLRFLHPCTILDCVPVTTLKRYGAGWGGAPKSSMKEALEKKHPEINLYGCDDNAVDAIWLLLWAKENFKRLHK